MLYTSNVTFTLFANGNMEQGGCVVRCGRCILVCINHTDLLKEQLMVDLSVYAPCCVGDCIGHFTVCRLFPPLFSVVPFVELSLVSDFSGMVIFGSPRKKVVIAYFSSDKNFGAICENLKRTLEWYCNCEVYKYTGSGAS